MFFQVNVNVIKSTTRTQLSNQTLDDLLIVSTAGVPLKEFNPEHAIDLLWKDKLHRPNQRPRAPYEQQKVMTASTSSETHENEQVSEQQKVMTASTCSETHESEQVSDAESNSNAESDSLLQSWDRY